jgi:hypothetical protein
MNIRKLVEDYENIEFEEPIDPFKAITDALVALGVGEPLISQRTPGEDDYEITWKTPSKIFDDSIIRSIASTLEDELNEFFA